MPAARIADLIRDRGHDGRAHVIGLSLGAQTAIQLLAATPHLVDHALLSGALVPRAAGREPGPAHDRRVYAVSQHPGLGPGQHAELGHPRGLLSTIRRGHRAATVDTLTHTLVANMTFRLPPGLDRVKAAVLVTVGSSEYGIDVRLSARCLAAIPGATVMWSGRAAQLAAGGSWLFNWTARAWIEPRAAG